MTILKPILLGAALSMTAACTTPFNADVTRFQRLPAPTGETFAIVPAEEDREGSLEFGTYARYVAGELLQEGYREVADPSNASMIVTLDYGVGDPREKIRSRPATRVGFGTGYWGYPGWGYRRGFYDPFFYGSSWGYGGFGYGAQDIDSYTVYTSYLHMDINRQSGEPLFEGRAVTNSRSDDLPELVPNLVNAMFTDFPGNNGRTVRVKVDQDN